MSVEPILFMTSGDVSRWQRGELFPEQSAYDYVISANIHSHRARRLERL